MSTLRLYFLGTLDIRYDGQPLPKPATLKSQSLLAYLILHRHRSQTRDRLAGLFWGDRPERKARRSLATALWHIRRCLPEDCILSDPHTVQFDPQGDLWLDVDEFESHVSHDDIAHLQSAVALYRSHFLDGFYDDWIINERYRLETLFCEALARLMVAQEVRGEHEAALATALRLLDRDPLREDAHRLAMRAYCRLGQRNAALEQYRRCREVLQQELGAEPMVETAELHQTILEGRLAGMATRPTPVGARVPPPLPLGRSPLDVIAPSSLVGREPEMAFLHECWERMEAGQGGLALISGEAGVGKTRLVEEFANHLRWQGIRVLGGRCYEFERVLPYQPIVEALRTILPTLTSAELADLPTWAVSEVARLVPEMLEQRPELGTPADHLDQEQARLFEGIDRFLAELSAHGALLVVLEDLHWASESTLQLVHYLARHLTDRPVLMVGTSRPEEIEQEHPLLALQQQLKREGLCQPLHLPRLSSGAVEAMIQEMSGAGEAVLPLARRLYRETEGNPFFLIEIVKTLFETDVVRLEEGAWQGDFAQISRRELPLPTGVSEAVQTRVHRLAEETQEALRLTAVLGHEFDFDLLDMVWGRDREATLGALDDLLRHRLVDEGTGTLDRDYAFTHHKIQEVVYTGIPRRRRQHLHAQVGTAMESLYGPQTEALARELAFHFQQGQQLDQTLTEKAITYLLQAGDQARALYAHREAIDHYRQALALLKEQGEHERAARTLMKLGLTYHTAFDFQQSRQAYQEGFTLWQRAGEIQPAALPPAPHPLRLRQIEPLTLDPTVEMHFYCAAVISQLFSGLVQLNPELDVVPDVARSWEVSEDGRKYVVHLRDDVRWSDGTPVTAEDFAYAWHRVLDPATNSPKARLLYDVKGARAFHQGQASDPDRVGVRALDAVTLAVELEEPAGHFLQVLAQPFTYPLPRHVVAVHGEAWTQVGNIVTNGPFRLEVWQRGESMVLVRNPAYHGQFGGNVQRVELSFADPSAQLESYEADDLDVLDPWGLPLEETERARQRHAGECIPVPTLGLFYMGFDVSRPPFDDVRVRRAFALANDKQTLADAVMGGYFSPATGGLVSPGMPGHSEGIALPYDPERARQLLAEAGYPNGRAFPVVDLLTVAARPFFSQTSEHLQRQWRENLEIEVTCETMELEAYTVKLDRDPSHMFLYAMVADYADPDDFLRECNARHYARWQNQAYDRLVKEARCITDQEGRMRLYRQADRILVQEAAIIPLTYLRRYLLVKPWVSRFPMSAINTWFWKDAIIEPH